VKLGDWVTFFLTVSSNGCDTAKDVTKDLIKDVKVNCRFSPSFKGEINDIDFEYVDYSEDNTK
jgi:hypothetical protein